jgi:hypothetical protein
MRESVSVSKEADGENEFLRMGLMWAAISGTWGTGLTNWTYYDMGADVILQRGETCHDKPDWMRREPCIM